MKLCRLLIATLLAAIALKASAQTDAQLSQYYEVPAYYNPAAIGLRDSISIRLGSRMQWIGVDNAPRSFLGLVNMPLRLGKHRIALGINASGESEGLFRHMRVSLQAAYRFRFLKGNMTAGLQLGFANEQFRGSEVFIPDGDDFHQPTDEAIPRTDVSGNTFDLGAGVYYSHRYFWAAIAMTHLNSPTVTFSDASESGNPGSSSGTAASTGGEYEFQLRRALNFMAGSNIQIKNTLFEVIPSVFVKSDFTFTRAEITGRLRWKKMFTFGLGYRHDDALVAILAAEYKGFYIGYSYDYPVSAISRASSGSHEIIAGYSLRLNLSEKNKNKHKSIRIM